MAKTVRLNDLQLVLLSNACARDNGSLVPLPPRCNHTSDRIGKAVTSLLRRMFVEEAAVNERALCWREQDQDLIGLFITDHGRAVIGAVDGDTASDDALLDKSDDGKQLTEDQPRRPSTPISTLAPSPRPISKISTVVALLQREHGATLNEIIDVTGWLPHSARAALTGLRKKGHALERTKRSDETNYRIGTETSA